MANNRMYLVNQELGLRVYIAKYFPSQGWKTFPDVGHDLASAFLADGHQSNYGHEHWRLEYEVEPGLQPWEDHS